MKFKLPDISVSKVDAYLATATFSGMIRRASRSANPHLTIDGHGCASSKPVCRRLELTLAVASI